MKQVTSSKKEHVVRKPPASSQMPLSFVPQAFCENDQLAHTKGIDERWSSQIGEVFLSVIRQMQQPEHLRHPRFTKSFLLTDLGLRQLLFHRQLLLPVGHPADGMQCSRMFVRPVVSSAATWATRFYGRAPTFLMATGYEQVRSVVAELTGDHEAAQRVELDLPETGVCSLSNLDRTGDNSATCCDDDHETTDKACCSGRAAAQVPTGVDVSNQNHQITAYNRART